MKGGEFKARKRRRTVALSACVVLCAVSAGSARAATIIGDDLTHETYGANSGVTLTKAFNSDGSLYAGSPVSGILTNVRVRSSGIGSSGHVRIVRRVTPFTGGLADFLNVDAVIPYTVAVFGDPVGQITTIPTRRAILAGDQLALRNTNAQTLMHYISSATDDYAFSFGAGVEGANDSYDTSGLYNWAPLVQGTVEPDANGDGYGDESQVADLELTVIKVSRWRLKRRATRVYRITNLGLGAASLVAVRIKKKNGLRSPVLRNGPCMPSSSRRSCVIPSLAAGASVKVAVQVTSAGSERGSVVAAVSSSTATVDPKRTNNSARARFRFAVD